MGKYFSGKFNFFLLLVILTAGVWFFTSIPNRLFDEVYATALYSKSGNLLGARIADDGQWRFPASERIPIKFRESLLHFEDRYFFDHPGINPVSLFRALKQNLEAGRVKSGGSTLTMQVIRLSKKNPPRTVFEKITEIFQALRLELTRSKSEILSVYAAHAPFGGNVVGLEAAAWRYYSKPPETLSWSEAATLAVLPNAPGLIYPGKNQQALVKKRNRLLKSLFKAGKIDSLTYRLACLENLPNKPYPIPSLSPHLLDHFYIHGKNGQKIFSEIDENIQNLAERTLARHMSELKANHIYNGAVLIADLKTGAIVAYVGNSKGKETDKGYSVDIIQSRRSPGSLLKPLLYASMLEQGELLPEMLVPDIPVSFGGYSPMNFNEDFDGVVPADNAIARSLNVPAVKLLSEFGTTRFHRLLKQSGISTFNNPADHYGLSIILGGAEVTLWELSDLYLRLARQLITETDNQTGLFLTNSEKKKDHSILPAGKGSTWFMLQAMKDVARPEADLNWQYFSSSVKIAWKTGTSFGHRDAWALGISSNYLIGVWTGNASGEGRPGLTGLSSAAPIMLDLFRNLPTGAWFEKPSLFEKSICSESGYPAGQNCPNPVKRQIPVQNVRKTGCLYHRLVHLDKTCQYQVSSTCEEVSEIIHTPWFILPPAMEWYYRQKHPSYLPLPPWKEGCSDRHNPIAVIYPSVGGEIQIPVTLDGTKSKTVFEAGHINPEAQLFWHLDGEFLGTTKDFHRMAVSPDAGDHTLVVVDKEGHSITRNFSVTGRAVKTVQ